MKVLELPKPNIIQYTEQTVASFLNHKMCQGSIKAQHVETGGDVKPSDDTHFQADSLAPSVEQWNV